MIGEDAMRRTIILGVVVFSVSFSGSAIAGHWRGDPPGALFFADDRNGSVDFQRCELTSNFDSAWSSNNVHDISPTDIYVVNGVSCDNFDIRMNDYAYGDIGIYGWWECHSFVGSDMCDTGHVHINLSQKNYSSGDALSLTCEEIGHSVGLGHRFGATTGTCMSQQWSDQHLDTHDTNVLNSNY